MASLQLLSAEIGAPASPPAGGCRLSRHDPSQLTTPRRSKLDRGGAEFETPTRGKGSDRAFRSAMTPGSKCSPGGADDASTALPSPGTPRTLAMQQSPWTPGTTQSSPLCLTDADEDACGFLVSLLPLFEVEVPPFPSLFDETSEEPRSASHQVQGPEEEVPPCSSFEETSAEPRSASCQTHRPEEEVPPVPSLLNGTSAEPRSTSRLAQGPEEELPPFPSSDRNITEPRSAARLAKGPEEELAATLECYLINKRMQGYVLCWPSDSAAIRGGRAAAVVPSGYLCPLVAQRRSSLVRACGGFQEFLQVRVGDEPVWVRLEDVQLRPAGGVDVDGDSG